MSDNYVGVYWQSRVETDRVIASKMKQVMERLRWLNPSIRQWFNTERPRKGRGPELISTDVEALSLMVKNDRSLNPLKAQLETKGVVFGFKSDDEWQNSIGLSFRMAHHSAFAGNACVIIANGGRELIEPVSVDGLSRVLRLLVEVVDPDIGFVQNESFQDSVHKTIKQLKSRNINFGWYNYVKDPNRVKNLLGAKVPLVDGNFFSLGPGLPPKTCEGLDPDFLLNLNDAMNYRVNC